MQALLNTCSNFAKITLWISWSLITNHCHYMSSQSYLKSWQAIQNDVNFDYKLTSFINSWNFFNTGCLITSKNFNFEVSSQLKWCHTAKYFTAHQSANLKKTIQTCNLLMRVCFGIFFFKALIYILYQNLLLRRPLLWLRTVSLNHVVTNSQISLVATKQVKQF